MVKNRVVSICGSSGKITDDIRETAIELGKRLATQGINIVCGGRDGVMEAVCEGVSLADEPRGQSIGVLPGESRDGGNQFCDILLPTGLGYARNSLVAMMGEVVIVIAGQTGTLCEATFAWQYGKPIVALAFTGGVAADIAGKAMDSRKRPPVLSADSLSKAESLILSQLSTKDD